MVSRAGVAACVAAVVGCATVARAADDDWEHYRHDVSRSGEQRHFSDLADPAKVPGLAEAAAGAGNSRSRRSAGNGHPRLQARAECFTPRRS